jgi:molybdopterin-guanine dinucleotide biosynthesis protein A
MGRDKAELPVEGVPQAQRIAHILTAEGIKVTVLGRRPVPGADFLPDAEEFAGPLRALAHFRPTSPYVFVASCDLPRFDPRLVQVLREKIGSADAAVPVVDGFRQPLCALYRGAAFDRLERIEDACAMAWLEAIQTRLVDEDELALAGLGPSVARGANTPEEFERAIAGEIA